MKLFYRQFGSGKPIIILHGLFGMSDNWVSIGKQLSEHFEVYIPDMRNHGQSPHDDVFSFSAMADDVLELIDDNHLGNVTLIGHSMGGKVAMLLALNHGDKVDRLMVIDISPGKYPVRHSQQQVVEAMQRVSLTGITSRKGIEDQLVHSISDFRTRQLIMKNLFRTGNNTFAWRLNLEAIHHNMDKLFDSVESDSTFGKPVLFIRGGQSDYINNDDRGKIRKLFPDTTLETIPQAGHWVHADAPVELLKIMNDFMILK